MTGNVRIGLAAATLGTAALLTGCGGGGEDFTDQSGEQIAKAAKADMSRLKAVKVAGSITTDGQQVDLDIQMDDQGDCTGTIGFGGGETELLGVSGEIWLRPDETFWKSFAPEKSAEIMAAVGDKWVVIPSSEESFGTFCDVDKLLDDLLKEDGSTYTKKGEEKVGADDAVRVDNKSSDGTSTGYVLVDDPHYLVKVESTGSDNPGSVTFSEFDEPVDVRKPAPGEVVDLTTSSG